ncbi:MAG TPA: AraC family transcriptional regulator [Polyangiaceae bacterium]|nr:AraC family transcriptional regulator [Polyangiaceae bacterium]
MPHAELRSDRTLPSGSFALFRRTSTRQELERGPTHVNPGYEVSYVVSGVIEFELETTVLRAAAGSMVLLPPDVLNTPRARKLDVQQVLVAPDLVEEAAAALGRSGRVPLVPRVIAAGSSAGALCSALAIDAGVLDPSDAGIDFMVQALLLRLVRGSEPRPERRLEAGVRRALEYMSENLKSAVRVEDLAREAGMSRFVFMRKFAAQVGKSPYRHLTSLRLARAAEQLRSGKASVLEVALEWGFNDPGRFARSFSREYGVSPRHFRARST